MRARRSFERRLRNALLGFSLLPTLVLLGLGTYLLSRAVEGTGSRSAWERVASTGRVLLREADRDGAPTLRRAATRHREELSSSLVQARRWQYFVSRLLIALPFAAVVLAAVLVWTALRAARRMARALSRPVAELTEWAGMVARGEPLPAEERAGGAPEFATLRDAFRAMERELSTSRARELEAERARSWVRMARSVAHELKNPLTPMRLAVRTLQAGPATEEAREAADVIAAESARLEELARSFAQFGRLPEGPRSEIDVREMLDYLLRTHLPAETAPRLRAPVHLPPIHGHHDALSRAFANLLLNAGDAVSGTGGTVAIAVRLAGDAVEVRIADGGPGIPPDHLARIWEPDFTTKIRGTGLGLALVRQTIEAHGGRVEARNRAEGGAEFRVLLPVSADAPSTAPRS